MTIKHALIIDCDGVLYPSTQISTADFVSAMKRTFFEDVVDDEALYQQISVKVRQKEHLGMFNLIKELCHETGYDFNKFTDNMIKRVDYTKITPNLELYDLLMKAKKEYEIYILTNNHMKHLNLICRHLFQKEVKELELAGIHCSDITSTERNNRFYPKQAPSALKNFAHQINHAPESCILIDDSLRNTECAQSIGMKAILVNENFTLKDYLKRLTTSQNLEQAGIICTIHKSGMSR